MRSHQDRRKQSERNEQAIRLIELIAHLDRLGAQDVYALAEHFGTSEKTIKRDLGALEACGVPLESEMQGKRKAWRIDAKRRLASLSSLLDASHYLALRVAMEPGASLATGSALFATLEDLGQKIEGAIGPHGRAQLAAIEQAFYAYEKRAYREMTPDVLWPLVGAISERRICRITYRAVREHATDKVYELLPLKLFAYDGALYLMCHDPKKNTQIKLNLQRLHKLRVGKRTGRVPRGFDPEALEHAAFGLFTGGAPTTYRLRFAASIAPYIRERTWHPTQRIDERHDGGLDLRFRCDASYEVDAWVQSWGDGVEVLAPGSLRAKLRRLGAWMVETYGAPTASARGGR